MAYNKTTWIDHIVVNGEVVQEGTPMNAENFNKVEDAIERLDADLGDMSTVPTTAKTAAGAIAELQSAVATGTNQTVREQVALTLETDTRKTVFEYTGGVLTAIVEKDGAVEVSRTTLNYNAGALTSVVEAAGGKTVTSTLNRDGSGNLTDITKGVV